MSKTRRSLSIDFREAELRVMAKAVDDPEALKAIHKALKEKETFAHDRRTRPTHRG